MSRPDRVRTYAIHGAASARRHHESLVVAFRTRELVGLVWMLAEAIAPGEHTRTVTMMRANPAFEGKAHIRRACPVCEWLCEERLYLDLRATIEAQPVIQHPRDRVERTEILYEGTS